jgi:hypothetical protein
MKTMNKKIFITLLFFTASLAFEIGCGQKKPSGFPALVPCSVSVTKDGKPIDKTVVSLSPVSGGGEWIASGITDSGGNAEISTSQGSYSAKGAPESEFKVFLTRPIEIDLNVSQQEVFDMSPAEREKLKKETDRLTEAARIIPEKLESIVTTPVKISVKKGEPVYKIELSDY